MNKYLIAASVSIFINFCAIAMEPAEEPIKHNAPIFEKFKFEKALQKAASDYNPSNIEAIIELLTSAQYLESYPLAQLVYNAFDNGKLDNIVKMYKYLPKGVSQVDLDDILEAVAQTNENDSNCAFMNSKITFDIAAKTMNVKEVIRLISQKKLIDWYLPAQLAYVVYKQNAPGILIAQDELPQIITIKQFDRMLYSLAEAADNSDYLKLYSIRDSIDRKILTLDPTGHIILPLPELLDLLDTIDLSSDSDESGSQDDESDSSD